MPSKEQTYREAVKAYLEKKPHIKPQYRKAIKKYLIEAWMVLEAANLEQNIKRMGAREVYEVYRGAGGGIPKKITAVQEFRAFLKRQGVFTEPLRVPKPVPRRPRSSVADFLTAHETMMRTSGFIAQRRAAQLLITSLSVRNIGMSRMGPESVEPTEIRVRDKGQFDGKERTIPITPAIYDQLTQYMDARREEIMRVLRENPTSPIPKKLLITTTRRTMRDLSYSTISKEIPNAGRVCGLVMSEHRLRRMVCREMRSVCKDESDVEASMSSTGHEKRETFMAYAGEESDKKAAIVAAVMENRNRLKR
jgi:integrase